MVANPEGLLYPRAETPRPSERRDVVWGKYVTGEWVEMVARASTSARAR
jgi:type IV pilus biogenesis protein CpaD/CtpE